MSRQLSDEALKELAFARYRQEHGIAEDRRLGDMPLQVVSEVLLAAQRLKTQEAER
jgi:hypothetical protein